MNRKHSYPLAAEIDAMKVSFDATLYLSVKPAVKDGVVYHSPTFIADDPLERYKGKSSSDFRLSNLLDAGVDLRACVMQTNDRVSLIDDVSSSLEHYVSSAVAVAASESVEFVESSKS